MTMDTSSQRPDPIADAMNLRPLTDAIGGELIEATKEEKPTSYDNDYDLVRQNLINLTEQGAKALKEMLSLADQSQSARAYEIVATLITNLSEVNEKILDVAQKHKTLTAPEPGSAPKTVNNNLFIGSTAELQKLIKQATTASANGTSNDIPG